MLGNKPAFAEIKYIYDRKKAQIKNRKFKGLAIACFIVGGYALLFGGVMFPAEITAGGVIGIFIGIALLLLGIKFISTYNRNNKLNS